MGFLPDGDALVTERDTARVLRVTGGRRVVQEVGTLDAAAPECEGGLLGVAVAPDYPADRGVYFYLTTAEDNRVVRAELEGGVLGTPEPARRRGTSGDPSRLVRRTPDPPREEPPCRPPTSRPRPSSRP